MTQLCKNPERIRVSQFGNSKIVSRRQLKRKCINYRVFNISNLNLEDKFVIVGAGIAGLASAVALKKVGIPVCVLESSDKLAEGGTAIGLWTNAFRALEELNVAEQIRAVHPTSKKICLTREDGRILKLSDLPPQHEFRGVKRAVLLKVLKDQIAQEDIVFNCNVKSIKYDDKTGRASIVLQDDSEHACVGILGADGVRSNVAASLKIPPPNFCGQYAIRGIVDIQGDDPPFPLENISSWWGEGVRFGSYQAGKNSLYWFVCFNGPPGQKITDTKKIKDEALKQIQGWETPLIKLVSQTPEENLSRSSLGDRWFFPNSTVGIGSITLAGDALHPMTPNLGQGGCTALEDAVSLAKFLEPVWKSQKIDDALRRYERARTARCAFVIFKSFGLGYISQSEFPPLIFARDFFASRSSTEGFLSTADYDVSKLQV